MKFSRRRLEEPEINLIPFIDVLLVVLIFLMLSTTYSKFTELQINLPAAAADKLRERQAEIVVAGAAGGRPLARHGGPCAHQAVDACLHGVTPLFRTAEAHGAVPPSWLLLSVV